MKKQRKFAIPTSLLAGIVVVGVFGVAAGPSSSAGSARAASSTVRVFHLFGTANAHTCRIPKTEAGTTKTPFCYTAPLFEFKDGAHVQVGTATDALADITQNGSAIAVAGATTFFNLSEGSFVSREQTTVQPTTINSPSVTHITGFIPDPGTKNILSGTGEFSDVSGTVRLSGAVNMTIFPNQISFECIFVATLD